MKSYDIIIIGAGPAGMSAAISASETANHILLLEACDRIGKKLLVTGNGRCNLTNSFQDISCYRSEEPDRVQEILREFSFRDTLDFFRKLGILTREIQGYVYPYNEQAASVREAFELYLRKKRGIRIQTGRNVRDIEPKNQGYLVHTDKETYLSKTVILTTGGFAGSNTEREGSGYEIGERMGHKIVPPAPALTALTSSAPFLKKLSGVRNQASIGLVLEGEEILRESGELQWTGYGISGVAIFQISRYAVAALNQGKNVSLSLDFLREWNEEELYDIFHSILRKCDYKTSEEFLAGMLPKKLVPVILKEAGIDADAVLSAKDTTEIRNIIRAAKSFPLRIRGYVGYEKAQVTQGGISLKEVTAGLESTRHPGLFFAGEVLDVDGTCGGYNLQWAFTSGNVAGKSAAGFLLRQSGFEACIGK